MFVSEKVNEILPAKIYEITIQRTAKVIEAFERLANILVIFVDGFSNSFIPKYKVRGNAIIPNHVIKVPNGKVLLSFKDKVNSDEPVISNRLVVQKRKKAQRK
ncbi:hypothetical protein [Polaribacter sp. MED152]|uniref:hypothetical protein n=1 Tax=Polaribacter sp. MED152 TaxID=313598 RepID=UPI000068C6F1|nr:hypothetical protein [Polaribacter sp. MED152]